MINIATYPICQTTSRDQKRNSFVGPFPEAMTNSPMAVTVEHKGEQIDGRVAGLNVSADLMGVATHGGERTHAQTAHLLPISTVGD
jgi:hypothetical protein